MHVSVLSQNADAVSHFTLERVSLCHIYITPFYSRVQKSTFSQPFKEKCISEVVVFGSIIISQLSKLCQARFFIACDVIFLVGLQGNLKLITLGSGRVKKCESRK